MRLNPRLLPSPPFFSLRLLLVSAHGCTLPLSPFLSPLQPEQCHLYSPIFFFFFLSSFFLSRFFSFSLHGSACIPPWTDQAAVFQKTRKSSRPPSQEGGPATRNGGGAQSSGRIVYHTTHPSPMFNKSVTQDGIVLPSQSHNHLPPTHRPVDDRSIPAHKHRYNTYSEIKHFQHTIPALVFRSAELQRLKMKQSDLL